VEKNNILRVKDWADHFENNRTRDLKTLNWVPVPNKHDGDGYTVLVDHKNGAAHLGAWMVILQVASKCDVRGTLMRTNGKPHNAMTLSRITGITESVLDEAIKRLTDDEIGWLEVVDGKGIVKSPQLSAVKPQGVAQKEGKGKKEQKEGKRAHGEYKHVMLTDKEYKKLAIDYDVDRRALMIQSLDEGIQNKGYKFLDHNLTLRTWARKDGHKPRAKAEIHQADVKVSVAALLAEHNLGNDLGNVQAKIKDQYGPKVLKDAMEVIEYRRKQTA